MIFAVFRCVVGLNSDNTNIMIILVAKTTDYRVLTSLENLENMAISGKLLILENSGNLLDAVDCIL